MEKLNGEDINAIGIYQGAAFWDMNAYMRGLTESISDDDLETIKKLKKAIDKCEIKENMILARGTTISWFGDKDFESLEVGDVLSDGAFFSASANEEKAKAFAESNEDRGVLAEIKVPKGAKAIFVDTAVGSDWEAEFIFEPGVKFVIEEKWIEDGIKRLRGVVRW